MTITPPSEEVAREHVMRCPCDSCAIWRVVGRVIESGTPAQRARLLSSLLAAVEMAAVAVIRDSL